MSHKNFYADFHRSLLAYCNSFITRHNLADFEVFDFDAHAAIQELPNKHLIGISDYSVNNIKDQYIIDVLIGVITKTDDKNIVVLRSTVNKLMSELIPGSSGDRFQILDESGIRRGYMTIGDEVLAIGANRTDTRPSIGISLSLGAGYLDLPSGSPVVPPLPPI